MTISDSRAEETRRRLIAAGLELFARHGFDGVTTRQLAAAARVNQAAIPYHFGGKEGVYRAVAEHIAGEACRRFDPLVARTHRRLRESSAREDVEALLVEFTVEVARIVYAPEYGNAWFSFASREQFHPSVAFERFYETAAAPLHGLLEEMLGRLAGDRPGSLANVMLTHGYLGEIFGYANGRTTLNRRLGREGDFGAAEIEAIIEAIERFSRMTARGLTDR